MTPISPGFVLKAFHEEPAALGLVPEGAATGDAFLDLLRAPGTAYRLYLAGTDLADPAAPRTGLSVLPLDAWLAPLRRALETHADGSRCPRAYVAPCEGGAHVGLDAEFGAAAWPLVAVFDAGDSVALRTAMRGDTLAKAADAAPDLALAAIRLLVGSGVTVLKPEPAPDGFDLHVFAPAPLAARFTDALRAHPTPGVRRFVAPYARMRSEARFYFERWGLDAPPPGVEEV